MVTSHQNSRQLGPAGRTAQWRRQGTANPQAWLANIKTGAALGPALAVALARGAVEVEDGEQSRQGQRNQDQQRAEAAVVVRPAARI